MKILKKRDEKEKAVKEEERKGNRMGKMCCGK